MHALQRNTAFFDYFWPPSIRLLKYSLIHRFQLSKTMRIWGLVLSLLHDTQKVSNREPRRPTNRLKPILRLFSSTLRLDLSPLKKCKNLHFCSFRFVQLCCVWTRHWSSWGCVHRCWTSFIKLGLWAQFGVSSICLIITMIRHLLSTSNLPPPNTWQCFKPIIIIITAPLDELAEVQPGLPLRGMQRSGGAMCSTPMTW